MSSVGTSDNDICHTDKATSVMRRSKRYLRLSPMLVLFVAFGVWIGLLIFGTGQILQLPNWGGTFATAEAGNAIEVVRLSPDGNLARAGIVVGNQIEAFERISDGSVYTVSDLTAIASRPEAGSYERFDAVKRDHRLLWQFIDHDARITLDNGRKIEVHAEPRMKFGDLGLLYFANAILSLAVLAVSLGIVLFARRAVDVALTGIAGVSLSLVLLNHALEAPPTLVLTPRLQDLTYILGNSFVYIYGYALVALVWHIPSPPVRIPFAILCLAFSASILPLQHFHLVVFPIDTFLFPYLLAIGLGFLLIASQIARSRQDPIGRARISWISVSILGAILPWALSFLVPQLLGHPPLIGHATSAAILALTWLGFTFATLRFRLFSIQTVWLGAIIWLSMATIFILADALLLALFDFNDLQAASIAMVLASWSLFPLKSLAIDYWLRRNNLPWEEVSLRFVAETGTLRDHSEMDGRILRFVRELFAPESLEITEDCSTSDALLENNGLSLSLPALVRPGTIRLHGRNKGKRLFSPHDQRLVRLLLRMARAFYQQHEQQNIQRSQERGQIARDLHDHLGAHILNLFYAAGEKTKLRDSASAAMKALRDSISLIEEEDEFELSAAWTDIWSEQHQRLQSHGLRCTCKEYFLATRYLDGKSLIHLKRTVEEAVTNVLKYSDSDRPVTCNVTIDADGDFRVTIMNGTLSSGENTMSGGRGLANLSKRAEELGAEISMGSESVDRWRFELCLPFVS